MTKSSLRIGLAVVIGFCWVITTLANQEFEMTAGPDETLYYTLDISESQATKALEALKETGFFDGGRVADVKLSRTTDKAPVITFVVKEEALKDPEVEEVFLLCGRYVLGRVFHEDAELGKVRLADTNLDMLRDKTARRPLVTTSLQGVEAQAVGEASVVWLQMLVGDLSEHLSFTSLQVDDRTSLGEKLVKIHLLGVNKSALDDKELEQKLRFFIDRSDDPEQTQYVLLLSTSNSYRDKPEKEIRG
jgi:hypothetical protein